MRGVGLLFLILPGMLGSSVVLDPPRTSYPLNSPGRPLAHFTDAQNTTTLLLSDDSSTLYVGARDAVLSLDVSQPGVITMKDKVEWKPSDEEMRACSSKGKDIKADCGNFIKVLLAINSTHLYVCGSFAYSPQDTLIDTDTLSMARTVKHGVRCPYNPFQRNTAVTINGELFSGTNTHFRGKPAIFRHFSQDGRPDVTQDTSFSLLNDPTFVSSSFDPAEGKVLFFFSEVAKEHDYVNDLITPRVAQVCKSDVGGRSTLQRQWTSFAKASLLCQRGKELPFNVLQDMFTLHPVEGDSTTDTLFYGVFTSQWSMDPGSSAVCVFKMSDIRAVFDGNYKKHDVTTNQWKSSGRKYDLGKCGLGNATGTVLEEVKKSFLTSDSVKQAENGPLLISASQQYSRLVVERTQAASGKTYTILFLLTENGFLHKVVLSEQGPWVIEEVQVFQHPQMMKNLILSSSKGVVYVGTSEGVTQVPLTHCPAYKSCTQCILARDPFCGWDHGMNLCTKVTAGASNMVQDVENGNVTKECVSAKAGPHPVVEYASLNDEMRLPCPKPSNLATLRWSTPATFPQNLFLKRPDGSLSFLVTADTLGTYTCVSEEGGFEEDIASYSVQLRTEGGQASPRGLPPTSPPKNNAMAVTAQRKTIASYSVQLRTEGGQASPRGFPPTSPPKNNAMAVTAQRTKTTTTTSTESSDTVAFVPTDEAERSPEQGWSTVPVSSSDEIDGNINYTDSPLFMSTPDMDLTVTETTHHGTQGGRASMRDDPKKSYYSELVAVSFLLAICVCVMLVGVAHIRWHHSGLWSNPGASPVKGGEAPDSHESVPSLSEEGSPSEVKVLQSNGAVE